MKRKRLLYDEWTIITSKRYMQKNMDEDYFSGIAALLMIDQVERPQIWEFSGKRRVVCDEGMKWLQIIPQNDNYVITTIFNKQQMIEGWYIDIIAEYGIDPDQIAYFYDLYLDFIVYPDQTYFFVDMDELEEALKLNVITTELYQLALATAQRIQNTILNDIPGLSRLCLKCLEDMIRN